MSQIDFRPWHLRLDQDQLSLYQSSRRHFFLYSTCFYLSVIRCHLPNISGSRNLFTSNFFPLCTWNCRSFRLGTRRLFHRRRTSLFQHSLCAQFLFPLRQIAPIRVSTVWEGQPMVYKVVLEMCLSALHCSCTRHLRCKSSCSRCRQSLLKGKADRLQHLPWLGMGRSRRCARTCRKVAW